MSDPAGNDGPAVDRVFLLSQHLFGETKAGPFVFGSHEAARRYAAEVYGTTDRGWWKQGEGHWTKHVKRKIVLPWNRQECTEDAYLTIREYEVQW
jgi:hypothetical protein